MEDEDPKKELTADEKQILKDFYLKLDEAVRAAYKQATERRDMYDKMAGVAFRERGENNESFVRQAKDHAAAADGIESALRAMGGVYQTMGTNR